MDEVFESMSLEEIDMVEKAHTRLTARQAQTNAIALAPYIISSFADNKAPKTKKSKQELTNLLSRDLTVGLTKQYHVGGRVYMSKET